MNFFCKVHKDKLLGDAAKPLAQIPSPKDDPLIRYFYFLVFWLCWCPFGDSSNSGQTVMYMPAGERELLHSCRKRSICSWHWFISRTWVQPKCVSNEQKREFLQPIYSSLFLAQKSLLLQVNGYFKWLRLFKAAAQNFFYGEM